MGRRLGTGALKIVQRLSEHDADYNSINPINQVINVRAGAWRIKSLRLTRLRTDFLGTFRE